MLGPEATSLTLAKLQNPVKNSLEDVHKDLEDVRKHQAKYSKLLDKVSSVLSGRWWTRLILP